MDPDTIYVNDEEVDRQVMDMEEGSCESTSDHEVSSRPRTPSLLIEQAVRSEME